MLAKKRWQPADDSESDDADDGAATEAQQQAVREVQAAAWKMSQRKARKPPKRFSIGATSSKTRNRLVHDKVPKATITPPVGYRIIDLPCMLREIRTLATDGPAVGGECCLASPRLDVLLVRPTLVATVALTS